jgi:hypothetical protein
MNKTKTGTLAALLIIGLVINSVPLLVSVAAATDGWTLIHDARSMKAYPDLKEYVWQKNASMPPNGPYDMIRLHRLVKTGVQTRGVVFFDPGTEGGQFLSNPPTDNFTKDENCSIAIYFANRGFDVYALDQRSAFIQNLNVSQMGQIMKDWGFDQRMGDTKEAIDKA